MGKANKVSLSFKLEGSLRDFSPEGLPLCDSLGNNGGRPVLLLRLS